MKHARLFSRLVLALAMPLLVTTGLAAQAASIQMNLLADWTSQKDTLMKIAAAMPEDRLGYKRRRRNATTASRSCTLPKRT